MPASKPVKDDAVFVGVPCYNRPAGLQNAIRCLQQQTHQKWTALISDNASPDPEMRAVADAVDDLSEPAAARLARAAAATGSPRPFARDTADQRLSALLNAQP